VEKLRFSKTSLLVRPVFRSGQSAGQASLLVRPVCWSGQSAGQEWRDPSSVLARVTSHFVEDVRDSSTSLLMIRAVFHLVMPSAGASSLCIMPINSSSLLERICGEKRSFSKTIPMVRNEEIPQIFTELQ